MSTIDHRRPTGGRERQRIDHEVWVDVDDRTGRVDDYRSTMTGDFSEAYRRGTDRWTDEEAIRRTPGILVEALGGDVRGRSVLDVGCGRGVDVESFVEKGAEALGIDLVPVADWDDVVRRRPGARFLAGDLVDLVDGDAVPTGAFDAILDNGCLHHQHPDRVGPYLDAVHAALAPHGLFVVSVFAAPGESGALMQNAAGRIFRDFGRDELAEWGRRAGFDPVAQYEVPRADGLAYLVAVWRTGGDPR